MTAPTTAPLLFSTASTERAKRLATAQARCCLMGITLQVTDSDAGLPLYIASFHALTKCFDDLGEVEAWLSKIGAPA